LVYGISADAAAAGTEHDDIDDIAVRTLDADADIDETALCIDSVLSLVSRPLLVCLLTESWFF